MKASRKVLLSAVAAIASAGLLVLVVPSAFGDGHSTGSPAPRPSRSATPERPKSTPSETRSPSSEWRWRTVLGDDPERHALQKKGDEYIPIFPIFPREVVCARRIETPPDAPRSLRGPEPVWQVMSGTDLALYFQAELSPPRGRCRGPS